LRAEHGIRAGAGAVGLEFAVIEDVPQQIEVLNHGSRNLTANGLKDTQKPGTPGLWAASIRKIPLARMARSRESYGFT
jgi:hypothetical protein